jgi:HAE1 family hydrophobic/amphiphilic exporter-1
LVDVVVFLPITFLPGTVGLFLREFGLVVTVATLTSLFVSFTVTPSLAGRWSLLSTWRPWRPIEAFTEGFERLRTWYSEKALSWGLARPLVVILVSLVTLVLAIVLIPLGVVGFEFIPAVDRGEMYLTLTYPTGTPLETTREGSLAVERMVDGVADISSEITLAGAYQGNLSGYVNDGAIGQIHIFLKPGRLHTTTYWVSRLQHDAARIAPRAQVVAIPATSADGGIQQPIDEVVSVVNGDPTQSAAQIYAALAQTKGATDVTTSTGALSPQVEVQFDRDRSRALDVSIGTTSSAIRAASGGTIATQYTGSDGLKDVYVIYPQSDLTNFGAIYTIAIRSSSGGIVHVADVAHLVQAPAPPLITRINRNSVVYVGANVADGAALSNVQHDFDRRVRALKLPAAVLVAPVAGGNQESVQNTIVGMSASLALSILLVYLLMVALYDSYRTPFVIMFSVPVAVVGALGALALSRQTLNLFSFIGAVLLIGLVTKNGILLVDFANRLRREGMESVAAVRESARERFRPIIMTTLAMIAGMTPLALSLDPGSQAERSLGTVVIGGLSSSLLLTLLLVPIVYLRFAPSHQALRDAHDPKGETRRVTAETGAPQ